MIINPNAKSFLVLDLRITETGVDILLGSSGMVLANGEAMHTSTVSIPLPMLANFGGMTGAAMRAMAEAHASATPGSSVIQ